MNNNIRKILEQVVDVELTYVEASKEWWHCPYCQAEYEGYSTRPTMKETEHRDDCAYVLALAELEIQDTPYDEADEKRLAYLAMLDKVETLTKNNDHISAFIKVAQHFGYDDLAESFTNIKYQNFRGSILSSYDLYKEMIDNIKKDYGETIYSEVYIKL